MKWNVYFGIGYDQNPVGFLFSLHVSGVKRSPVTQSARFYMELVEIPVGISLVLLRM